MKTTKIFAMLLSLVCLAGLSACEDQYAPEPIGTPNVTAEAASYESLAFSWDAIANAVQYGYRLSDPAGGTPLAGVTKVPQVSFSGLKPATTYKLEVWAFAAIDGGYTTPPAVVLTATTDALIKLATPEVTITESNGAIKVSWNKVEFVEKYVYTITNSESEVVKSGSTTKTSMTINGLADGEYVFAIYAANSEGKYENSETASAPFTIDVREIWRARGTYYCIELNATWPATIVAYSNSTYTILAFYGAAGYNLEFSINESSAKDKFAFLNGTLYEQDSWKCWNIPTGIAYPDMLWAYPWDNYSYLEGDETSGEVGIGLYYGDDFEWGYDVFTWGGSGELDISSLAGSYNTWCYGSEADSNWVMQDFNWSDYTSTIDLFSETEIVLDGFYWTDCGILGTVDISAKKITFAPQEYYWFDVEGYLFASASDVTGSVEAVIKEDGSIYMPNFGLWYQFDDGSTYLYSTATLELTPADAAAASLKKRMAPGRQSSAVKARSAAAPGKLGRPAK